MIAKSRVFTAIIAVTAMLLATLIATNLVFAQEPEKITLNLTGSEEVPPVETEATGVVEFGLDLESIPYSINATNIEGVTAGHIHFGKAGENGPVVVTLFKYDTPMNEVSETGTITAELLEGPLEGKQISDLITAGSNGTLYINVHTEENPNGEIRGQS
jgi:CHRD domain